MKNVQVMNRMQLTIVNNKTLFAFNRPAGISRIAVLGFFASKLLSKYRLKDMAALRAKTIHRITRTNFSNNEFQSVNGGNIAVCHPGTSDVYANNPRKNPIIAKGIAKMVWENFIRLR